MNLQKMSVSFPHFEGLNSFQRQAVEATEGYVLVLAGAGTGKTRVLTSRIAYILNQGFARPYEILAVTFTNKAAQEMKERVSGMVGAMAEGIWLGTFHSLCVRILRKNAESVGLTPSFTILDTDDQLRLLKQIIRTESLDEKKYPPRLVSQVISRWKDRGLLPEQVAPSAFSDKIFLKIYKIYQFRLLSLNSADFGDLLLHVLTIFKSFPDILEFYQNQFRYILVDEYQDTNVAQYLFLRLLCPKHKNLCCVGDDDQAIYGWRGAEVENILKFESDFLNPTVIRLEQNYRSTQAILEAASSLIAHNAERHGKTLWTELKQGEQVTVKGNWNSEEEARFIAGEIFKQKKQGRPLSSISLLVRASFQTREFEETFLRLGLPYRVIGGVRFYERKEIRDALAYIRFLAQPDDGLAFERLFNTPKRGIGQTTVEQIHLLSQQQDLSFPRAAFEYAQSFAKGKTQKTILELFSQFERWRERLKNRSHIGVVEEMLQESGYIPMLSQENTLESQGRLENIKELFEAMAEFESIQSFLDHVSLVIDSGQKDQKDVVTIMTLHAAKGLEFPVVFLAGWEEGLFPHPRCLQDKGQAGLEEERRLGYVGISRAREKLFITYALSRRHLQKGYQASYPSRFLKEIKTDRILHILPNGGQDGPRNEPQFSPQKAPLKKCPSFAIDDTVIHETFGSGRVEDVEGDRIGVEFEKVGYKKIIASFLRKAG